jgi:acetyltransferase-like isoleucine patch superfamily enzyme
VPAALDHDWFPVPLPDNVILGERSWLYSAYAFVHCRSRRPHAVRVGRDSGVYHGSFFDLGPRGEVMVGDFCTLVGAVFACNSRVIIGDYVFIAHEVTFADEFAATPGAGADGAGEPRTSIVLGDNSWIGARVVLLAGARVGTGAILGAGTVVDFEVPPYAIVGGNPARVIGSCAPA